MVSFSVFTFASSSSLVAAFPTAVLISSTVIVNFARAALVLSAVSLTPETSSFMESMLVSMLDILVSVLDCQVLIASICPARILISEFRLSFSFSFFLSTYKRISFFSASSSMPSLVTVPCTLSILLPSSLMLAAVCNI